MALTSSARTVDRASAISKAFDKGASDFSAAAFSVAGAIVADVVSSSTTSSSRPAAPEEAALTSDGPEAPSDGPEAASTTASTTVALGDVSVTTFPSLSCAMVFGVIRSALCA